MKQLEGKVALVTGAGRGLGRACASLFAQEGAKVVVVDIDPAGGMETVRLIADAGSEAMFVEADVARTEDIRRMVDSAVDRFGGLHCAINNAVCNIGRTPLCDIAEEDWARALAVNVTGVFRCMKYEIRAMLATGGGGAIVNIGSGNEFSAKPGLSWYLGAKQSTYAMAKCAALDYAADGIRVNAVGPGSMWTPLMREAAEKDPAHLDMLLGYTPMRRIAEPEEVAAAAVWLCTPKASYVTGHVMLADGGAVLG